MFDRIISFIGHFHLVFLHIPIGVLLLSFLMYISNGHLNKRNMRFAIDMGLFISMISAAVACICGLFLSWEGGYDAFTLKWHKYLGFTTTVLSAILFYTHQGLYRRESLQSKLYFKPFFILALLSLIVGGHLGGTLTHGKGYLFKQNKNKQDELNQITVNPLPVNIDRSEQIIYPEILQKIFDQKCIGCHNPEKKKGELLLTSKEGFEAGGKNGPIYIKGSLETSPMIKRINLPLKDDDHMPPDGKTQLTDFEKKIFEWWVKNHSSFESKVKDLPILEGLNTYQPGGVSSANRVADPNDPLSNLPIPQASEKSIERARAQGFNIYPIAQNSNLLEVVYSFQKDLTKKRLHALNGIQDQIRSIDLSHTNLSDEMMPVLSSMPHLVNVNLNNTAITDAGIGSLSGLKYIQSLNLFQTSVTNLALQAILKLKSLKHLYVWQTNINQDGITSIQDSIPGLEAEQGIRMDTMIKMKLPMPVINNDQDLFHDSIQVDISSFFKNAVLKYTLDSTIPDGHSNTYLKPFSIKESANIVVIAYMEGWLPSDTAYKKLEKTKNKIKSITWENDPPTRFLADGSSTLYDLKRGGSDAGNGKWIAYQKEDMVLTVDLGNSTTYNKISVGTHESPGYWAFYPAEVYIESSTDGINYKKIINQKYPAPIKDKGGPKKLVLSVPTQTSQFIKIRLKNLKANPSWHREKGKPSWVFCDEIMID